MDKVYQIELDNYKTEYLYVQLYNQLKKMIMNNQINAHTKLPPIRKLADKLGVNNITVVNAYRLLEQDDFVYKRVGSGTFVNNINSVSIENFESIEKVNYSNNDNKKKNFINIDFASGIPTPDLFPVVDFKIVLNEVLDRDKSYAFAYQEGLGFKPLRESIKNYISEYGISSNIENIQIVSGAQQGIDILSKTLIDYGDIVFTESPTYTGAIAAFKSRAARIIEVPIDNDGIDVKVLKNKLNNFRPKFIYVMPNFQNPTGFSYSNNKKIELLELAKIYNTYIIEDDYLSDLSFSGISNQTLKSLDKDDRVIYIKSFSKLFMPGLRLGFAIIPTAISRDVLAAKHTSDISTSGLLQRSFDLYLKKEKWQKHINFMERIYKDRYKIMQKSIKRYMPKNVTFYEPYGGLNFWFSLPDGYSASKLLEICIKHKIFFVPGTNFYANKKDSKHFRLSIASVNISEIDKGIRILSKIIYEFLKDSKNKNLLTDQYPPYL